MVISCGPPPVPIRHRSPPTASPPRRPCPRPRPRRGTVGSSNAAERAAASATPRLRVHLQRGGICSSVDRRSPLPTRVAVGERCAPPALGEHGCRAGTPVYAPGAQQPQAPCLAPGKWTQEEMGARLDPATTTRYSFASAPVTASRHTAVRRRNRVRAQRVAGVVAGVYLSVCDLGDNSSSAECRLVSVSLTVALSGCSACHKCREHDARCAHLAKPNQGIYCTVFV